MKYQHLATTIRYDDEGQSDGFPVLLIAPGGMKSANALWDDMPWNPRAALADTYRLIGMDQRNAGGSAGPVTAGDGWHTFAGDQLGLLDHLGIERCHVIGMCIGGPYVMGLLQAAPKRFASAVLLQPVGIDNNREALYEMFDVWAEAQADQHPDVSADDWRSFRSNMWDGDFVLTATPEQVAQVTTPLLVAMGNDLYHPQSTSRQIASLAPEVTFVESWKTPDVLDETNAAIQAFLAEHTSEVSGR